MVAPVGLELREPSVLAVVRGHLAQVGLWALMVGHSSQMGSR